MSQLARLHKIEKVTIAVRKVCPWLIGSREVRLSDVLHWAFVNDSKPGSQARYYEVVNSLLDEEPLSMSTMWKLSIDCLAKQTDECVNYLSNLV